MTTHAIIDYWFADTSVPEHTVLHVWEGKGRLVRITKESYGLDLYYEWEDEDVFEGDSVLIPWNCVKKVWTTED